MTHGNWDFIDVAKVGGSYKRWRHVLGINYIDGYGCRGGQNLMPPFVFAASILRKQQPTVEFTFLSDYIHTYFILLWDKKIFNFRFRNTVQNYQRWLMYSWSYHHQCFFFFFYSQIDVGVKCETLNRNDFLPLPPRSQSVWECSRNPKSHQVWFSGSRCVHQL